MRMVTTAGIKEGCELGRRGCRVIEHYISKVEGSGCE